MQILVVRAALAVLALLMTVQPGSARGEAQRGKELAEVLCAQCHLNEGQGEKQGPMGIPGFRAVANRQGQTLEGIVAWLKSVPPIMPNHHLTQDEMFEIAAFIMSLRDKP